MPWYAWLIIVLALGSIVGGLLLLRDSAKAAVERGTAQTHP